jgi:hypothetical protein
MSLSNGKNVFQPGLGLGVDYERIIAHWLDSLQNACSSADVNAFIDLFTEDGWLRGKHSRSFSSRQSSC